MERQKLRVQISEGKWLTAEVNLCDEYRELCVFVEENDGSIVQDIVVVSPRQMGYDEQNKPVYSTSEVEVKVYADCLDEDWTQSYQIPIYEAHK